MNQTEIKKLQAYLTANGFPLVVDGHWGPLSQKNAQRRLISLMPSPNPWPTPTQAALRRFYGRPDDNSRIISVSAPAWLRVYDTNKPWGKIQVHERCADSLLRALQAAYEVAPLVVSRFFGCHVDRPVRGGTVPSTHAYGCAVDLDATPNGNRTHWPTKATMPFQVMECFAREGWTAAGVFWSRDAMHFQATRPQ